LVSGKTAQTYFRISFKPRRELGIHFNKQMRHYPIKYALIYYNFQNRNLNIIGLSQV